MIDIIFRFIALFLFYKEQDNRVGFIEEWLVKDYKMNKLIIRILDFDILTAIRCDSINHKKSVLLLLVYKQSTIG